MKMKLRQTVGALMMAGILFFLSPADTTASEQMRIPVLCSHNFTENSQERSGITLYTKDFDEFLRLMTDKGYKIITPEQFLHLKKQNLLVKCRKYAILTIDDGYNTINLVENIIDKYEADVLVSPILGDVVERNVDNKITVADITRYLSNNWQLGFHTTSLHHFPEMLENMTPLEREEAVEEDWQLFADFTRDTWQIEPEVFVVPYGNKDLYPTTRKGVMTTKNGCLTADELEIALTTNKLSIPRINIDGLLTPQQNIEVMDHIIKKEE